MELTLVQQAILFQLKPEVIAKVYPSVVVREITGLMSQQKRERNREVRYRSRLAKKELVSCEAGGKKVSSVR